MGNGERSGAGREIGNREFRGWSGKGDTNPYPRPEPQIL